MYVYNLQDEKVDLAYKYFFSQGIYKFSEISFPCKLISQIECNQCLRYLTSNSLK